MTNHPTTVAISLSCTGASGRQILSGIFDYIHTYSPQWATVMSSFENSVVPIAGCIFGHHHANEVLPLALSGVPMVAIDLATAFPKAAAPITHVTVDNRAIARLAAEHFAEVGPFRSYAFVHGQDKPEWSIQRERWFRRQVARKGAAYAEFQHPALDAAGRLMKYLTESAKPIAVFCAHDLCATSVLSACKLAGLKVPSEVAILGVDNDTFLCDHSSPSLSSIEPDFELEGFLAAKELDRMLTHPRQSTRRIRPTPVKGVVVRASTRLGNSADGLVQAGMDFIHNNFSRRISVLSVTRAMGVSRRLAELRFRQVRGAPIGATIIDVRLRHVQHLLKTTKLSVAEIAHDSGFADASYMTRLFRKRTGRTPRDWGSPGRFYAPANS